MDKVRRVKQDDGTFKEVFSSTLVTVGGLVYGVSVVVLARNQEEAMKLAAQEFEEQYPNTKGYIITNIAYIISNTLETTGGSQ